jgi:hypothetical protein
MTISMILPEGAADAERRTRLRRMKSLAAGLLLFAAAVFLITLHRTGFWGYVNSGAEASMVGAIADWFAVTALFRHPLGLPIPHTALIPKRKDEFGKSLEDFVQENFLQEEIIRERLVAARVSARVGAWLSHPVNAAKVVAEGASLATVCCHDWSTSRSRRSPATCWRRSSATTPTTAWSTSPWRRGTTGWPTTRRRSAPSSANGRRDGHRTGSTRS